MNFAALTARERDLLLHMSLGGTYAGYAQSAGIGVAHARNVCWAAMKKLGATHRAHAVAMMLRAGEMK